MRSRIPALTILQPWADAIVHLDKRVENRPWRTSYTGGWIYVHTGQRLDVEALDSEVIRHALARAGEGVRLPRVRGAIIGAARLTEVHRADGDCCPPWGVPGSDPGDVWHWVLGEVRPAPRPVPCRGALGLWWPTGDLADRLAPGQAALLGGDVPCDV